MKIIKFIKTTITDFISYSEPGATPVQRIKEIIGNNNDILAAVVACTLWQPDTQYQLGQQVRSPNLIGLYAECVQAGTSGDAEPTWGLENAITLDGTVKWIVLANNSLNLLQRNTAYQVGDIAYSKHLPSWARLECVKAGTTANVEPQWTNIHGGGSN